MTAAKFTARRKAGKPRAGRPAKIPGAKLRKLAAALERDDLPEGIPEEIQALSAQLAELGDRAGGAAAAVLAQTRRGSRVARAYLEVLALAGDGDLPPDRRESVGVVAAADVVARHCATMTRGRKALRPAFLAAWRCARDVAALDAACKNLARVAIDDPQLLAVAAEVARRIGDAAALADHTARLERASRLAPLLAELCGAPAARARATRQLDALSPEDRRHIHARVIDHPRGFDKPLAIASVLALVDDPRAPDMALAAAVFELPPHGKDQLVAAWKPRVIAGDAALIVRLLALFEWTGLWATDDAPFGPYIEALAPAGWQADVFAQVESGLASDKVVVRDAILHRWLSDPARLAAFTDPQADNLMRGAIAIAETGATTTSQRAAHRAVACAGGGHPGVRRALIDGVRHATAHAPAELRGNLYHGLARIDHPEVTAFLIDRLFVERAAYSAMMDALAARLDAGGHRAVLAALGERRADPGAIHAATVYADTLIDKRRSARMLGDLARAVLTWQPTTSDDTRRLRYVFEQATLAAITIAQPRDARACLARARALEVTPYSDYQVRDRDRRTPAAFGDAAGKQRIAALELGEIDHDIASACEAAEAARAASTPIPADDTRLGALAGCAVASRFLEDRAQHEVWFFDELGELHVYDGYAIALPAFEVTGSGERGISHHAMAGFLAGQGRLDERVVLYDTARGERAREVLRLGDRLLVLDGRSPAIGGGDPAGSAGGAGGKAPRGIDGRSPAIPGGDPAGSAGGAGGKAPGDHTSDLAVTAIGLRFADPGSARAAVARFATHPPAGTRQVDPFHIAGLGVVRRTYQPAPATTATANGETRLAVAHDRITGTLGPGGPPLEQVHPTTEAAITALEAWEVRVLAAGGRITAIAIDQKTS